MKRRGFALWEVVAVICVVLIIVVVSIPFFAREGHGRRSPWSVCQSNLKQIGFGFRQYTQDYDEKYPLVAVNDTATKNLAYGWADALYTYTKSTEMYHCPSETNARDALIKPTQVGYTDYWFNQNLAGREEEAVKSVSQTILSGDGNDGHDNTNARYSISDLAVSWRTDKSSPAYRHDGGANYGFADGHVKWLKPVQVTTASVSEGGYTFAIE